MSSKATKLIAVSWASTVTRLLGTSRPSAIRALIAFVIIIPLKRQVGWSLAHVSKEVFEFMPSPAYFYSTSAIILVPIARGLVTSGDHRLP